MRLALLNENILDHISPRRITTICDYLRKKYAFWLHLSSESRISSTPRRQPGLELSIVNTLKYNTNCEFAKPWWRYWERERKRACQTLCHRRARSRGKLMRLVRCFVGWAAPRSLGGAVSCWRMIISCAHPVDKHHTIWGIYRSIWKTTNRYISAGPIYHVSFFYRYRYITLSISFLRECNTDVPISRYCIVINILPYT